MFGYVSANKPELKMREFYKYKAYYCGLCRTLGEKYGFLGKLTLTYDMTFLVILLTSLYEKELRTEEHRCIIHPVKKHKMLMNEITEYAADMNIVLTYFHLLDDWEDERSKKGYLGMKAFRKTYRKLERKYPEKCKRIQECLKQLAEKESQREQSVDEISRPFGELMAELFLYQKDQWEPILYEVGFYLGKFIYILDAFDDVEKDVKAQNYNVFIENDMREDLCRKCEQILTSVMAECTRAFELLPCIEDAEILRNILYAGVWEKFDKKKREMETEENG